MTEKLLKKDKSEKRKKIKKKKRNKKRIEEMLEVKSNIDDIFSNIKIKNKSNKVDETEKVKKDSKSIIKNKKKKDKNQVSRKKVGERLYTPDGLPIYSMEELKMGKGGYTKECPFECNCCF
ncbi:conserved protein, unknown function [Plasmodium gallinaceum]|uniref:DUF1764 domain-containing protein n=1 Tax=Plasmodium gallinaceum TaxID=5849 RepID=A0A1J1GY85_PLAGA|nr:conserved protein, unknown function [Plasmodium gallinaceum]CRG96240.1 conserved protein, unknown function [Plasmodium gallinaceum]